MRTVAIIQARTGSSRFPCKVLAALDGKPMLAHVIERAKAIKGVDQVVLAIPELDQRVMGYLHDAVYTGSEKDVLGRFAGAATAYDADVVVRLTGDCPLLAPDLIERELASVFSSFVPESLYDIYVPGCQPYTPIADGWDFEIMTDDALQQANLRAAKGQREHVTTWLREPGHCFLSAPTVAADWTALKCSVDTKEDLARCQAILDQLDNKRDFSHQATWAAWERAGKP